MGAYHILLIFFFLTSLFDFLLFRGLGKTLQTLYCILIQSLESLYMKYPSSNWISMQQALREIKSVDGTGSKVLIIAPASLVHQWKEEISKHFSNCILFNPILCLPQNKDWLNSLQYEQPNSVFIASFDTVRSYSEDFASPVWDVIVIDEAHCIRNPSSQLAKCIFALRGKHRIALSGTPLQNQVQDIWSLMNFVMHGYLGDQEKFKREYEVPIKRSLRNLPSFQNMPNDSKNASKGHERKVCMTSEGIALLRSLQKQVLPFILRRTKEEVLDDLPPKTLVDVPCPLSSVQRSMYEEVLQKSVVKEEVVVGSWQRTEAPLHGEDSSLDAVEFYCNISRSKKKSVLIKPAATSSVSTFSALRCLSLLAVHPALVIPQAHQAYRKSLLDNLSCSGKVLRLLRLLWELHITSDDEMVQGFGSLSWYDQLERNLQVSAVGKLTSKAMDDSQDEGDKDDEDEDRLSASAFSVKKSAAKKCLIFAQHHDTLNILESAVFQRYLPSVRYAKLDGTMSPEKRFSVVQNFNKSSHGYIGQELDNAHTRLDRLKSMLPSTAVKPSDNDHVDDIRILLLTTKACGLGLNLTAADTVIFIEHDWNPFVDSQAMDRVHRLGQINPVTVYRLIADATIEARLLGLQNFKQYVSREILPGNNDKSGDKDEELWKSFLTK
ncbi:DEAD/DEAH box helicase [archaeon]|nr:MAG: DEAD/DEAH box helicase [archaeon]